MVKRYRVFATSPVQNSIYAIFCSLRFFVISIEFLHNILGGPPVENVDLEVPLLARTHVAAVGAVPAPAQHKPTELATKTN
jgi:hypothetical protein